MISTAHRFIFVHAPKTGGNSVQQSLLPYSDDRMVLRGAQDGIDRFEIRGPVTRRKHMRLQDYADALGERLSEFRVVFVVRDPLDRALSMYFSPHRVQEGKADANQFRPDEFESLVAGMRAATSFVSVGDEVRLPDNVLRFSNLEEDFAQFIAKQGIPPRGLSHLNEGRCQSDFLRRLREDEHVKACVRRAFASDYSFFGAFLPH